MVVVTITNETIKIVLIVLLFFSSFKLAVANTQLLLSIIIAQ